jgi:hypothetical protein
MTGCDEYLRKYGRVPQNVHCARRHFREGDVR